MGATATAVAGDGPDRARPGGGGAALPALGALRRARGGARAPTRWGWTWSTSRGWRRLGETRERREEIRQRTGAKTLILSAERLDYVKGALERLRVLRALPGAPPGAARRGDLRPDRRAHAHGDGGVPGRCGGWRRRRWAASTGASARMDWQPMIHFYGSFDREELVAFYTAADVAWVTPLRDGLNLVAKEYIACDVGGDGVVILSEFAGAAAELRRGGADQPLQPGRHGPRARRGAGDAGGRSGSGAHVAAAGAGARARRAPVVAPLPAGRGAGERWPASGCPSRRRAAARTPRLGDRRRLPRPGAARRGAGLTPRRALHRELLRRRPRPALVVAGHLDGGHHLRGRYPAGGLRDGGAATASPGTGSGGRGRSRTSPWRWSSPRSGAAPAVLTDAELVELRYAGRSAPCCAPSRRSSSPCVINGIVLGWVIRAMTKIAAPFVRLVALAGRRSATRRSRPTGPPGCASATSPTPSPSSPSSGSSPSTPPWAASGG